MHEKQHHDYPVSTWRVLDSHARPVSRHDRKVKHAMSTDIFSVEEKDSVELVLKIMEWKNIHHMPVVNQEKELVGILSWTDLESFMSENKNMQSTVKDVMVRDLVTIDQFEDLEKAKEIMSANDFDCLPVIYEDKLIGIITANDL